MEESEQPVALILSRSNLMLAVVVAVSVRYQLLVAGLTVKELGNKRNAFLVYRSPCSQYAFAPPLSLNRMDETETLPPKRTPIC